MPIVVGHVKDLIRGGSLRGVVHVRINFGDFYHHFGDDTSIEKVHQSRSAFSESDALDTRHSHTQSYSRPKWKVSLDVGLR